MVSVDLGITNQFEGVDKFSIRERTNDEDWLPLFHPTDRAALWQATQRHEAL